LMVDRLYIFSFFFSRLTSLLTLHGFGHFLCFDAAFILSLFEPRNVLLALLWVELDFEFTFVCFRASSSFCHLINYTKLLLLFNYGRKEKNHCCNSRRANTNPRRLGLSQ
jgi:hypothetical protein